MDHMLAQTLEVAFHWLTLNSLLFNQYVRRKPKLLKAARW